MPASSRCVIWLRTVEVGLIQSHMHMEGAREQLVASDGQHSMELAIGDFY